MTEEKFEKAQKLMFHINHISGTIEYCDEMLKGQRKLPLSVKVERECFLSLEQLESLENRLKELFFEELKEEKKTLIEERKKLKKEFEQL